MNNITKDYRPVGEQEVDAVNQEKLKLARLLDGNKDQDPTKDKKSSLAKKLERYSRHEAFVTVKDTKEKFDEKPACNKPSRLIIPSKTDIGKVSRKKLQVINSTIREKTGLNQWLNTMQVLKWFRGLKDKDSLFFFKLDVVAFYPNISHNLLKKAIDWARNYCTIDEVDETHRSLPRPDTPSVPSA